MRKWRVGTISMGILLVATGILLLMSELQGVSGAILILRWWPIILIILGIEVLAFIFLSKEDQPKIKFDGLSIFLTIFIVLVSTGVYATHTFVTSDFSNRFFSEVGFYKYESVFDKSFEVESAEVKRLEIDNSHGDVNVAKYDGTSIKIEAVILIKSNDEIIAAEIAENLIAISEAQTTTISTKNESILRTNSEQVSVNYYIKVPKELEYDIKNKFGETILENLAGDIMIESAFGKIEAKDIQGDVQIINSHSNIEVRNITGRVEIDNEHGNILYSNKDISSQDIILISKFGDITAELANAQQGSFQATAKFGEISLEGLEASVSTEIETNKQQWVETIGTASPRINLEAEHGHINIIRR